MKEIKTMKAVRLSMLAAFAALVLLSGCGQKGPLTLPKDPAPTTTPADPTKPTTAISEQPNHQG
jgi:predicted small lipoprotein YifL